MLNIILILTALNSVILILIFKKQKKMGVELDNLTTEVSETKTIMASAKVLIEGLKDRLDDAIASGDPAALQALSDDLNTGSEDLAAAIAANTPSDPNA